VAQRTWPAIGRAREKAALAARERQLQSAIKAVDLAVWELDLTTDKAVRSLRHDQMLSYHELQQEWGYAITCRHIVEEDLPLFDAAFQEAQRTGFLRFGARSAG
jgi:hypothetical protein